MAEQLSPMMQNYLETKKQYNDCVVMYRLGDFYEMFFDDATLISKELELTLTGKSCGLKEKAPMCGIPYHALDGYLNRLVKKGYKVAICDQVEDPKLAKGLVKREVTRIVTPGTNLDMNSLDETKHNYLMSVVYMGSGYGVAVADISTGTFLVTKAASDNELRDEIYRFEPSEIVCNEAFLVSCFDIEEVKCKLEITVYSLESWYFDDEMCTQTLKEHFHVLSLDCFDLTENDSDTIAAGALLKYLYETQMNSLEHMRTLVPFRSASFMILDAATRRNLELTETIRDKQKRGSLFGVLDKTKTALGARTLRSYIEQPLLDKTAINMRLDAVEELFEQYIKREELREYLNPIYDLERLTSKICYKSANPRDLIAFKSSLEMLPHIKNLILDSKSKKLKSLYSELDPLTDLFDLIEASIDDDPPIPVREGGIIKSGYSEMVDSLRNAKTEGKNWLAKLEAEEKERTGIKNLKVKYSRVFGYCFEVTNSFIDMVPEDYSRKQTLTGAERYTSKKLKELEDTILNAEDKLFSLEYDLFCEIRNSIEKEVDRILHTASIISEIDALASLAYIASKNNYVRPKINDKGIIDIKAGRHPVVENMMDGNLFIDNDTFLDNSKNRISIITGPNMAGKSTYMRQSALIVLMAQIGSFVPAREANIGLVDRIFTRVGASDDLASGQSTFMVEMTEVANILRNATSKSLLILDEIGRGTSTFDGLSIAWAVIEYIADTKVLGAKTLFATHYHELTELEGKINSVNNYCIAVKEQGEDIVFLRKIVKGGADKSYGIQVARLAGVPSTVLDRARELVDELLENDISVRIKNIAGESTGKAKNMSPKRLDDVDLNQMSLFDTVKDDDILKELSMLELNSMTPMDALNTLYRLQNSLKNRW